MVKFPRKQLGNSIDSLQLEKWKRGRVWKQAIGPTCPHGPTCPIYTSPCVWSELNPGYKCCGATNGTDQLGQQRAVTILYCAMTVWLLVAYSRIRLKIQWSQPQILFGKLYYLDFLVMQEILSDSQFFSSKLNSYPKHDDYFINEHNILGKEH